MLMPTLKIQPQLLQAILLLNHRILLIFPSSVLTIFKDGSLE